MVAVVREMFEVKPLAIFYTRTGITRKVAERISGLLKCDIEEMVDLKNTSDVLGYFSSGMDATLKKLTVIKEPKNDPSSYDVVISGTPVWADTMSTSIRTYISENNERLRRVAFFCTYGGSGVRATLRAREELCGTKPLASLELRTREVANEEHVQKCTTFVNEIDSAVHEMK